MSAINTKALVALAKKLNKQPLTVMKISKVMKCSRSVAAKRIDMLRDLGCRFEEKPVKEARRGLHPIAFKLLPNNASKKLLASA